MATCEPTEGAWTCTEGLVELPVSECRQTGTTIWVGGCPGETYGLCCEVARIETGARVSVNNCTAKLEVCEPGE